MHEEVIKIKYAPNTTFIVGSVEPEINILNSKRTGKNKYNKLTNDMMNHCQLCREKILLILN